MKHWILPLVTLLFACSKENKSNNGQSQSFELTISDLSAPRLKISSTFSFLVKLNKPATSPLTVHYTTLEGTAKSPTDFTSSTGILNFSSGETEKKIDVVVTGDSLRREDQLFYVELSDADDATIKKSKATGTISNKDLSYFPVNPAGYIAATAYPGYNLVWSDEFNASTIDANTWTFEEGNNNGWGNNELEYYTPRSQNAFTSNGNLIIEARSENYRGAAFTSARMISKGKRFFKFGRVDIRAKLPVGKGIWPALWMIGNNIDQVNWPACGEIDMMEYLGHQPDKIYGTLHWGPDIANHKQKGSEYTAAVGFDQQFHVYSILWEQNSVKVLVDDVQYAIVTAADVNPASYPFNNDFFFLVNLAVGGNWPGAPDANTKFPQRLVVDYIRIYQ